MKFKCFRYLTYLFIVNLKIFVKRVLFFCSRLAARPSESKWSPGSSVSNSSLAHELWKVPLPPKALSVAAPSRPPPGLTSQKPSPASSGWDGSALRLGGWSTAESRYTPGKRSTPFNLNSMLQNEQNRLWGCCFFCLFCFQKISRLYREACDKF